MAGKIKKSPKTGEKKEEDIWKILVEHMGESLWRGDKYERTVYANPNFCRLLGYSLDEMKGKYSYDFWDKESARRVREENKKRKKGISSHYTGNLVAKTGRKIPVVLSGTPLPDGGTMGIITDLTDVKQKNKKIEELSKHEKYLAIITNDSADAIIGIDNRGIIQWWNRGAESIFGYSQKEVIGTNIDKIIPKEKLKSDENKEIRAEINKKGFVRNYETVRIHKKGHPIIVSLTQSRLRDKKGKLLGYSIIYRDISLQKKWDEELQDRYKKLQDAYKELGKRGRQVDYLIDMLDVATGDLSIRNITDFITSAVVMLTKVDACTIRLYNPKTKKFFLSSMYGLGKDWYGKGDIPFKGSLAEDAFKKNSPIRVLDIEREKKYKSLRLARRYNLRSMLVIPLKVKDKIKGTMSLYLSTQKKLSLLDDDFVINFAKQAAIAIELNNHV